jgi:SAM-dependent methyltransferase
VNYQYIKNCKLCNSWQLKRLDDSSNICKCSSCGYIFDNPRPSSEDIQVYYSKPTKYDLWLRDLDQREILWKRRLKLMIRWKKQGNLLDIGTGIGQFLSIAGKDFTETCGTEISDSAILIAKERYGLDVHHGSVETIDFSNRKFDNITIFHVLEHVDDPRDVIRKCRSLLNEGGMLFIAVPNDIQSIKAKGKNLARNIGIFSITSCGVYGLPKIILDGSIDEIHLSHFTPEVLESMLEREGFRVIESSMDPYFISTGIRRILQEIYYLLHKVFFRITRLNLYDTIWIVSEKR